MCNDGNWERILDGHSLFTFVDEVTLLRTSLVVVTFHTFISFSDYKCHAYNPQEIGIGKL